MLWKPKVLARLAALTGFLTILTCVTFARMPDRFVQQIGWFVVAVGAVGGVALAAVGRWWEMGRERRTASVVLGVLGLGDIACNLAAMRLGSPGVVPIPWILHGATIIAATVLVIAAAAGWVMATETSAGGHPTRWGAAIALTGVAIAGLAAFLHGATIIAAIALAGGWLITPERSAGGRATRWGAAIALTGVAIAGFAAFSSLATRAIVPNSEARSFCRSIDEVNAPFLGACLAREEAKPLSTNAYLIGLGGFGAAVFGTGLLCGSLRPSRPSSAFAAVAAILVGVGALNVAARVGTQDLDRLHETRALPERSCEYAVPRSVSQDARVLQPAEQAVRDCVVDAHGTNPWGWRFWVDLAIAILALFGGGWVLRLPASRRASAALDSA